MVIGAVGGYSFNNNNGYGQGAVSSPPATAQPPKDPGAYPNGHDYYVDLMRYRLATATSTDELYRAAVDVFQMMEDNRTPTGDAPHHVQEAANDHEHSRTRKDLKQLVATALGQRGIDPGTWGDGRDNLGNVMVRTGDNPYKSERVSTDPV